MPDDANALTGTTSLNDAIAELTLSSWSESQLSSFLSTLQDSSPPVTNLFTYLMKYIEYNRSGYLGLKLDLIHIRSEFTTLKRDVSHALNTSTSFSLPHVALLASGATSMPYAAAPPAPGAPDPTESTFLNAEGTFSCRMGHVGNRVMVTFSSNDEVASQ